MEAVAEKVQLTREEYEQLLAKVPQQTITVDAAEYAALVAHKESSAKLTGERDRLFARVRELETCLRREQGEHEEELDHALAKIKKMGG